MRVSVRYPDDAPPPAQPVRVTVDRRAPRTPGVEQAGSETETLQLVPRAGTRATYEALLTRTPEGTYTFSLTDPPPTGPRPTAEATVLPPPGELDRIQLNEQDLRRAAKESRGAYYSLDAATTLPDDLPGGTHVALDQPVPPLSLWDHPLAFALVLWLLTAEWIMRKKWRLL